MSAQIDAVNAARADIKGLAADVLALKSQGDSGQTVSHEVYDNIMLAYRHLEDASMRLGKVIQALDGGISVYDKRTTVGA